MSEFLNAIFEGALVGIIFSVAGWVIKKYMIKMKISRKCFHCLKIVKKNFHNLKKSFHN